MEKLKGFYIYLKEKIYNQPSLFILLLPFSFFVMVENTLVCFFPFLIAALEILFINKFYKIKILFIVILNTIFYTQILYDASHFNLQDLRLRHFTLFFLFFNLFIYSPFFFKKISFKFHNTFYINLSLIILIFNLGFFKTEFDRGKFLNKLNFEFQKNKFNSTLKKNTPVLLIILDEFSSNQEIYKLTKNIIDLKFDNFTRSNGFIVKENFPSLSQRTSISVPSLFNFNFHKNLNKDSIEKTDKGLMKLNGFSDLLKYNLLVDSLKVKEVDSYSFGITSFKEGINDEKFFYYWDVEIEKKFYEIIIDKTIIGTFLSNRKRKTDFYDNFRKSAILKLNELELKQNSFYYFHLYFPHDPYSYFNEYPSRNLNYYTVTEKEYLKEHVNYKRWFINKFEPIIKQLKEKNIRIIICGDHGFRYNHSVNPTMTSGYFYGYNKSIIDSIKTVQDIGYLILESFD